MAVNYVSDSAGADCIVEEIKSAGGIALAVQGDVSNVEDVRRMFDETETAIGPLSVLVNNAGFFAFGPFENVNEDSVRRHLDVNVLGPILTSQEAMRRFPHSGGSIVNIGSGASVTPTADSTVYGASKAALDALSRSLAKALGSRRIRVNVVAPGGTETEGAHRIGFIGSEAEEKMIAATPLGRLGRPEDIAKVVVFLASDDAFWVTGARINVSGGLE